MATTQRVSQLQSDTAPLWLPYHDEIVVSQAASPPPARIDGYTLQSRLKTALFGSRWKTATTVSTAIAVIACFALVPSFLDAGVLNLLKLVIYQSWTLAILLIATARVRTVTVGTVARYWLAGLFPVTLLVYFLAGPMSDAAGVNATAAVWVTPVLAEIAKALPLAVAVLMGRRAWRHPGVSDLVVLGFAVGAGYAFHTEALWQRSAESGFGIDAGLLVPTIFRADGLLVVGHAVWTALIGLAIGLYVFHRHQAAASVGAFVVAAAVLVDHMSIADVDGVLAPARQLLFDGTLVVLLFLSGALVAAVLDHRRLAAAAARDHLFPASRPEGTPRAEPDAGDDLLEAYFGARYRKLRTGMHNTVAASTQHWPPRSEAKPPPLAELARLGRAADISVGPGTASTGWAPDPESTGRQRFVGPNGFTVYTVGATMQLVEPDPATDAAGAAVEFVPGDSESETPAEARLTALLDKVSRRKRSPIMTATAVSPPTARPEAVANTRLERPGDFLQFVGLGLVAVALFVLVRLLTAGDASTAVLLIDVPRAPASPVLIQGLVGALAAAVSIRGRDTPVVAPGWQVGPGEDPIPDRPAECEA